MHYQPEFKTSPVNSFSQVAKKASTYKVFIEWRSQVFHTIVKIDETKYSKGYSLLIEFVSQSLKCILTYFDYFIYIRSVQL